jgi:sec-independent protein translocase protein TatA
MPSLGGWEFVILIGLLVLFFGWKKLPDMARSVGQSARVFKGEMKGMKGNEESEKTDKTEKPADATPPAALPPVQETPQAQQETSKTAQPGHSNTPQ